MRIRGLSSIESFNCDRTCFSLHGPELAQTAKVTSDSATTGEALASEKMLDLQLAERIPQVQIPSNYLGIA